MAYEPLHHKYRPQTFSELVGQSAIATTLANAITQLKIAPAYLFAGPRGTGKTSSARIFAKSLNCLASDRPTIQPCGVCEVCQGIAIGSALDVVEIDAASNTGVDNMREIIERANFAPVQCRYKVYAIDECHMLSVAAFNALLKTLEEPPPRVVFILATTDPQRVLPTIISRCQRFDFRRIQLSAMTEHLGKIAVTEEIAIEAGAINIIAQIANGGLRDAESLLDQLSLLPKKITVDDVWDLVGAVAEQDLLSLLEQIFANKPAAVIAHSRQLMERGKEPLIILQNLAGVYRDLLIVKSAPHCQDLLGITSANFSQLERLASLCSIEQILQGQQHLRQAEIQLKNTTQPSLWLEITILGLLPQALVANSSIPQSVAISAPDLSPAPKKPVTSAQSQVTVSSPAKISKKSPSFPKDKETKGVKNISASDHNLPVLSEKEKETIWQRVIACLPPTAEALFKQQCHLIKLTEKTVEIGVSSAQILKQYIDENKKLSIEKAFSQILNKSYIVNFHVTDSSKKQILKSDYSESINSSGNSVKPSLSAIDSAANNHQTEALNIKKAEPSPDKKQTIENNSPQTKTIANPAKNSHNHSSITVTENIINPTPSKNLINEQAQDKQEIPQAIVDKIIKKFNGELVNLDNYIPNNNLTVFSAVKPENNPEYPEQFKSTEEKKIIRGRPNLAHLEDEDEVPF